jgi:hypothetical protein
MSAQAGTLDFLVLVSSVSSSASSGHILALPASGTESESRPSCSLAAGQNRPRPGPVHAVSFVLVTMAPQIGDLRPVAGSAASRYESSKDEARRREVAVMAHVVVRIIELLFANILAAAVTAVFVIAVITVVQGLRSAGRHQ